MFGSLLGFRLNGRGRQTVGLFFLLGLLGCFGGYRRMLVMFCFGCLLVCRWVFAFGWILFVLFWDDLGGDGCGKDDFSWALLFVPWGFQQDFGLFCFFVLLVFVYSFLWKIKAIESLSVYSGWYLRPKKPRYCFKRDLPVNPQIGRFLAHPSFVEW